jgi:hypothetical protein
MVLICTTLVFYDYSTTETLDLLTVSHIGISDLSFRSLYLVSIVSFGCRLIFSAVDIFLSY